MEQQTQPKMLVHKWLYDQMYTLRNQWDIEWQWDQQRQMETIEENTGTGKGLPQNGLDLKVYQVVGFLQSQLNQEEELQRQAQNIFQMVDCAIWEY